ncbi:sensor domain-containing protein [Mycolicibacterium boenickei]
MSLLSGCGINISIPRTSTVAATVLPVEQVQSISGVMGLHEIPELDVSAPLAIPNTPAGCRGLFDPPTVFGSDWKQFRAAGYTADIGATALPSMPDARQAVAVYPDSATAQARFDRLTASVPDCTLAGTGYHRRTVKNPQPDTLLLNSEKAGGPFTTYRVSGSRLLTTTALGLPDGERVALDVLDALGQAQR